MYIREVTHLNKHKKARIIYNIVSWLVAFAVSIGLIDAFSPYFLTGVRADRGYDAVGGEYILILIVGVLIAFGFHSVLDGIFKD